MANSLKDNLPSMLSEQAAVFERLDAATVDPLIEAFMDCPAVFGAAAGRSGLLLRCAVMRLMHLGKAAYVVGDVVTPALVKGDLLLVVSGSGETGGLVGIAQKAKALGGRIGLVTANPASTLAGLADVTVALAAPTPKAAIHDFVPSRQPMGNLFEQCAFLLLDAVVMELMNRTGKSSESMFTRHANLE